MKISKRVRRIAALVMALVVMCLPSMEVLAASQVTIYCVNLPRGTDSNKSNWGHGSLKLMNGATYPSSDHFVAKAVNSYTGKMAYCVEPGKALSDETALTSTSNFWTNLSANKSLTAAEQKAFVARIMYYGYSGNANINWSSSNSTHANEMGNMIATQLLIWETLIGERNSSFGKVDAAAYGANNILETISGSHPIRSYIMSNYNRIVSAVQSQSYYPSFMNANSGSAPTYELTYDSSTGKYSKTFTDTNGVLSGFSLSSNTSGVEFSKSGNNLTISMNSAVSSTVTVTASRSSGTVSGMIVWAAGSSQSVVTYGENVTDSQTAYLKFTVKETNGKVSVTKKNEAGAALSGVTFNIYSNSSCTTKIGSMVTNSSGQAVSADINTTQYPTVYVKEYSVASGDADKYNLNTSVYSVKLVPGSTVAANGGSAVINEWRDAYVKVLKRDESGKALSGVTFSVYSDSACSSRITTITTGSDGYGTSPAIDVGTSGSRTVYVKETAMTSAQSAVYKLNTTVYPVTISANQTASVNSGNAVINEWKEGYVKILKQNEAGTALSGVVFTVYSDSACTKAVTTITTGSDGYGTSPAIDVGTTGTVVMYVKETSMTTAQKALYKMNPTVFKIEVGAGSTTSVNNGSAVVNEWLPAKISVTKVISSGAKLSGASFTAYSDKDCKTILTDMSGKNVVIKTDANGYAISTDIYVGKTGTKTIYVKETALDNPDADIIDLNPNVFPVTIQPNVTTAINSGKAVVNEYKPGKIMVVKENQNGNRLAGITFSVYTDKACRTLLTTMVTDSHGVAISENIPIDGTGERKLYVKETAMTEAQRPLYELSSTVYPVTIYPNQTIQANNGRTIINRWTLGQISLEKQNENGEGLAGVVFAIYEDADCVTPLLGADGEQVFITTGKDGKAVSEGIEVSNAGTRKLYVREKSMPDDMKDSYELNTTAYPVAISAGKVSALNDNKPIVNKWKPASFLLSKTNPAGSAVVGAEFTAYSDAECKNALKDIDGKPVVLVTDKNGCAESEKIKVGKDGTLTVYLRETAVADETVVINPNVFEAYLEAGKTAAAYDGRPIIDEWVPAKVELAKVNANGNPLEGVVFTVYDDEDCNIVAEDTEGNKVILVTDKDGRAVSNDIYVNADGTRTLYVRETEMTEEQTALYKLNETVFEVEITAGMTAMVNNGNIVNEWKDASLSLSKQDEDGNKLKGVSFGVYEDVECTVSATDVSGSDLVLVTDENGCVSSSDIPVSEDGTRTVYVKEVGMTEEQAKIYSLCDEVFTVTLNAGKHTEVNEGKPIINKFITAPVRITKADMTTADGVPGAKIQIFDGDGKMVYEGITKEDGRTDEVELRVGKYTFVEVVAPDGYVINKTVFEFEVNPDGTVTGDTTVTDKPTEWKITKKDVTTADTIPGAEITIYDADGKEVFKGITAEDGTVTAFKLPAGEYTFKETVAPEGYVINETVFKFVIDEEGNVTGDNTVTDRRIKGDIRVTKIDSDSKDKLKGATFGLYSADGKTKLSEGVTGDDGTVTFSNLEYGKYIIKELNAPVGFLMKKTEFEVEIKEDGKVVEISIENSREPIVPAPYIPKTGESSTPLVVCISLIIASAAVIVFMWFKKSGDAILDEERKNRWWRERSYKFDSNGTYRNV